ncbi:MAG: lipid A deacylase LpxR family protein [Chitinophagaceae bacterium]|nr:lipid A deacylase LpxR family protein [Chitinophagaceae bacterium]
MRYFLLKTIIVLGLIFSKEDGSTQPASKATKEMFRIFEDNDFINLRGKGTDEAYTNGIRFDLFYEKQNAHSLLSRWMPKVKKNATNTYGWSITQLMYTPQDISKVLPDPKDFSYGGALFITHSLNSSSPNKKLSFNSELLVGLIGPYSFAKETQQFVHQLIHYQLPMGWDQQIPTDLILNLNFSVEKQLLQYKNWVDVIGGSEVKIGTYINSISTYSIARIGKKRPYFNGFINRYSNSYIINEHNHKWQAYIIIKPRLEYQFHNSIISGGYFGNRKNATTFSDVKKDTQITSVANNFLVGFDYGFSLVCNKNSLFITQQTESAAIKNAPAHEVGNISFYKTFGSYSK